ncbi:MAG: hypothetical protein LUG55_09455 [Clostridiales bacterium]|nr:hypothetical protein [Clostridiales bacterium]
MASKKKKKKRKSVVALLRESPINYMSDLFIVAMVLSWIIVIFIMVVMAIWATVNLADTSVWCYVQELTGVPLTAGGAIWMVKNGVQHAIANNKGKQAHMDFPAVNADGEDDGIEKEFVISGTDDDEVKG